MELSNLYLFAAAIGKCALMTLIGPGILLSFLAERLMRRRRIPVRNVVTMTRLQRCRTLRRSA